MEIRKCMRCKKFFNTLKSPYCGECLDVIDRECKLIHNYIAQHPDADASEIANALVIDERTVLYLLREGRLEMKAQPQTPCQSCGQPIRSGRFCPACVARMSRALQNAGDDRAPKPRDKETGGTAVRPSDSEKGGSTVKPRDNQMGGSVAKDNEKNTNKTTAKPRDQGMFVKRIDPR
jgi:ribosomal protein L32